MIMGKIGFAVGFLMVLAACGDPLAGVPRISEVDLVETDPTAQALPTAEEISREGFFNTPSSQLDSGAIDPPKQLDTAQSQPAKVDQAAPRSGGLLGLLRRATTERQPGATGAKDTLSEDAFEAAKAAEPVVSEDQTTQEPTALASLTSASDPVAEIATTTKPVKRGLFGRLANSRSATTSQQARESNLPEVEYGTQLPYGVIARSCASRRQPLGRKVDAAPASGYKLYDTNPGAAGPRTFYITGFDDGCPRQLTAAHVLLGEPSFYEQLYYGPAGQHLPIGETDRAYEKIKGRICGVRKGKPCGAKMKRLERETIFVNAYGRQDDNNRWSEQLIHDGQVLASAMKSSG
ncbi:hypothetical protein OS190_15505 [Sulfitobacter sp. F26204]|uniref:hypothetical protein n=1 Tax=Sulfitobacter sp. F26204 TaxID=2996014 RepID=UPI00225E4FE0|nr:hypothetical protein [Sulfitobacter sp. F26204]MCX7560974.1 hypothetical protein [Sulfitobacter sp. F26204]